MNLCFRSIPVMLLGLGLMSGHSVRAASLVTISQPRANEAVLTTSKNVTLTAQAKAERGRLIRSVTMSLYRYKKGSVPAAYWTGGTNWSSKPHQVIATISTAWSVKVPSLVDGHYSVTATATDNAGQKTTSGVRSFWVEATPPKISIGDVSVKEPESGTATATFALTLDKASRATCKVKVQTTPGVAPLATAGSDYVALSPQVVTFAPGQNKASVKVTIRSDALDEDDETFRLSVARVDEFSPIIARGQGTATIRDSDPAPQISVGDISVTEGHKGQTAATFTVSLSASSGRTVKVNAETVDGTASAGTDYMALPRKTLTFAPGTKQIKVTVPVIGDLDIEELETTFSLKLSGAVNASLGKASGVCSILDDDDDLVAEDDDYNTESTYNFGTSSGIHYFLYPLVNDHFVNEAADPFSSRFKIVDVEEGREGHTVVYSDDEIVYTVPFNGDEPPASWVSDSFTYTMMDEHGHTAKATITISGDTLGGGEWSPFSSAPIPATPSSPPLSSPSRPAMAPPRRRSGGVS